MAGRGFAHVSRDCLLYLFLFHGCGDHGAKRLFFSSFYFRFADTPGSLKADSDDKFIEVLKLLIGRMKYARIRA